MTDNDQIDQDSSPSAPPPQLDAETSTETPPPPHDSGTHQTTLDTDVEPLDTNVDPPTTAEVTHDIDTLGLGAAGGTDKPEQENYEEK